MAVVINTAVDPNYFTLNGTRYARIYQPLKGQVSTEVGIYNAFDTCQQLLNSTPFDEFTVDSLTYASADLLIIALLPVIYKYQGTGAATGTIDWGSIGGTLSAQTDLQAALDAKSNTGHTHSFASLTSKPTTLSGFGITDAYTETEVDTLLSGKSDNGHLHTPYFDILDNTFSVGLLTDSDITDNLDGTVDITAFEAAIKATDTHAADVAHYAISATTNLALTDGQANYIYAEYNAGSPQVVATTAERTNYHQNIPIAIILRSGTTLHIDTTFRSNIARFDSHALRRWEDTEKYQHVSGAAVGETGTRLLTVTAGTFWRKLNNFNTAAFDTSVADTFSYFYADGIGGWTEVTAQTAINNTQYDDGSGTLATLTSNRYGVHYVYAETDDDLFVLYGTGNHVKLEDALAENPPTVLPDSIAFHGILLAKIVVLKSATNFETVQSAFPEVFTAGGSAVTSHLDLTDIGTNTHAQIDTFIGTTVPTTYAPLASPTFTGIVTAPVLRLTDTTDVGLASTGHTLQIGADAGLNLRLDGNEIMSVNNGVADTLNIQRDGGIVQFGAATALSVFQVNGNDILHKGLIGSSGDWFDKVPYVNGSGVMEIGRYIDFHTLDATTDDFTTRLDAVSDNTLRMTTVSATTRQFEVYISSVEFARMGANASGGFLTLSDDTLTDTILRGYGDSEFYGGDIIVNNNNNVQAQHFTTIGDTSTNNADNFNTEGATAPTNSVWTTSNTTGSTNFPTAFGQALWVNGAGAERHFAFWRQKGILDTNSNLYFGTDRTSGAMEWSQVPLSTTSDFLADAGSQNLTWELRSEADCTLTLTADSDNITESHNPKLYLVQDGLTVNVETAFGIEGDSGAEFTGSIGNYAYIRSSHGIQFSVGLKGVGEDDVTITTTGVELANSLTVNGILLDDSTDRSGLLQIGHTENKSWHGIQIKDDAGQLWSLFGNAVDMGMYDDTANEWIWKYDKDAGQQFYYNGVKKLETVSGGATTTGDHNATDFNATSDRRLKKSIKPLKDYAVTTNWVKYNWRDTGKPDIGLVAQDLEKTNPEFVKTDANGFKSIAYSKVLVAKQIENENKLAEKDKEISSLQFRLEQLEAKMELIVKELL